MIVEKQIYTIDDVWDLAQDPDNENMFFELIDGELFSDDDDQAGNTHVLLASRILPFI